VIAHSVKRNACCFGNGFLAQIRRRSDLIPAEMQRRLLPANRSQRFLRLAATAEFQKPVALSLGPQEKNR